MKRISWKSINSWICFALLLAPGLYLFGGYIGQLAGSHGEFMYAEPAIEGGIDYSVEYDGSTYQRFGYGNYYGMNLQETGTGFDLGYNNNNPHGLVSSSLVWFTETNITQGSTTGYIYFQDDEDTAYYIDENGLGEVCLTLWVFYPNSESWYIEFLGDYSKTYVINQVSNVYTITEAYENYWPTIPYHYNFYTYSPIDDLNWNGYERIIPETQPNIQSAPAIEQNAQGNTEFQQGQFFSRNNFLKKWGDSVVSEEETWGFAPFKALIQYLDGNMLHFASNGVQYGLMAYGYMYYALHIVLLDLVFYITSFLPRILKKLAERLEGGLE